MRKLIFLFFLSIGLYANSVQVFSSNTMHIKLDKNVKFEELFLGDMDTYIQKQGEILNAKNLQNAAASATLATVAGATARGIPNKVDLQGGLIGAAGVVGVLVTKSIYDGITKDNTYMYITMAVNSKGEKTILYNYVVANYALELKEVKDLAMKKIKGSL